MGLNKPGLGGSLRKISMTTDLIPSSTLWQSTSSTDEQTVQDWWNENWTYQTTDSGDTEDQSFVDNRHGATNSIRVWVAGNTADEAWYETTEFDLTDYDTLTVWAFIGSGGGGNSDIEIRIYVDGDLRVTSLSGSWKEFTVDVSGDSGQAKIRLAGFNNRGTNANFNYSEFQLE